MWEIYAYLYSLGWYRADDLELHSADIVLEFR